jgi:hypothetical protein
LRHATGNTHILFWPHQEGDKRREEGFWEREEIKDYGIKTGTTMTSKLHA